MKKKVLILANHSIGLYNFRRDLINCLREECDIYISVPNNGFWNELESLACRVIETHIDRRGMNPIKDFKLLCQYLKIVEEVKPDLVITYTIKPNVYGGIVCRIKKIQYVANITGLGTTFQKQSFTRRLVTILYKVALEKSKVTFFENDENRHIFIDENIVEERQTYLLNGAGVELQHFALRDYPKETNPIRFLFSGRVMKEKGVEELFGAMQKLRADGSNCVLDIIGEYEEDYEESIKKYQEEGWLNFYGYQSDVRPFIEKCHCFVLPSYHEGMANTNLESAAMGRPVITSNIHGCKEAIIDGVSGYLSEKQDKDDLYRVMKKFVLLTTDERKEMGLAGRRHMELKFDKKQVVKATIDHIRE